MHARAHVSIRPALFPARIGGVRLPFSIPPADQRPFDVVTFGLNSVDLIAVVPEYPERNTKQQLSRFARLPGGQMATAAVVCARLGWRARYIGAFGDDELGRVGRASLDDEGVEVSAAWTVANATNQFAVVVVDAGTGERTVLWNRHPALAFDTVAVPHAALQSGRVLIVDCYETAASTVAARSARAAGAVTIIDIEEVRPGVSDLLQQIDAIVAAQGFPAALTGYDQPGRALEAMAEEFAAPLVCVTLGDEGSLARCGGREIRTPAFAVDCVDTTGAGDAFRGGLAAGCLRSPEGDLEEALAYANAVAALNCRALGARGASPRHEEVERLMAHARR